MSTPSNPASAQKSSMSMMVIFPASNGSLKEKALRLVFSFLAGAAPGAGTPVGTGATVVLIIGAELIVARPTEARVGIPAREARKFLRCIWQVLRLNLGK